MKRVRLIVEINGEKYEVVADKEEGVDYEAYSVVIARKLSRL